MGLMNIQKRTKKREVNRNVKLLWATGETRTKRNRADKNKRRNRTGVFLEKTTGVFRTKKRAKIIE